MDKIRLKSECLTCIAQKQAERYPKNCSEELQIRYKQRVYKLLSEVELTESAPVVLSKITEIQRELFGNPTDYREIKQFYNRYVLEKYSEIERKIAQAADPLRLGMQYALAGNYIDFGAMDTVDHDDFERLLGSVEQINLNYFEYTAFCNDMKNAKQLVYLTDNCGEIVFDKAFIRQIQKDYPRLQITVIVWGREVLNDATLADAEQIGLGDVCSVIDNGNGVAGTSLGQLSDQARQVIEEADMLIAKGQGNFETLRECGLNIYYLFLCKCKMFAKRFQVEQYTGLLVNDRRL